MTQVVYLSEVKTFFKKNIRRIFSAGILGFLLTFSLVLFFSNPLFLAEASFRHSASTPEETSSLQSILRSMKITPEAPPASSVMGSKTLLKKVVQDCGLQIEKLPTGKLRSLLQRELGFSVFERPAIFSAVEYTGEHREVFTLTPLTEKTFEVSCSKGKMQGQLGTKFALDRFSFTLQAMPRKQARFCVIPEREALSCLKKQLKIKPSRLDNNILLLTCRRPERGEAIAILNAVMSHYQDYLRQEHEQLAEEQIVYLQKRRDEIEQELDLALDTHVCYLENSLKADGVMGLSQELALLSEPKEMYTGKRHELDLEQKKWKEEKLEAYTEHPWKEGLTKQEDLSWKKGHFLTEGAIRAEYEGLDLVTAEKLHGEYCQTRDQVDSQIKQLDTFLEKVIEEEFELTALSQVLSDEVSRGIIQKATECREQLADRGNYREKEQRRLEEVLKKQKLFLSEHLEKQKNLLESKYTQIEEKIAGLKQTALTLIEREKTSVDAKLLEIKERMRDLPAKWGLENRLKLKKELNMQILEGLTQLSESKVVNHHLFHVESKPLDYADASPQIQPPHLFLFSSMGGMVMATFYFFFILMAAAAKGFPVSEEYLRSKKYPLYSDEATDKLALALQNHQVITLVGFKLGGRLATNLKALGHSVLHLVEENWSFHHKDFPEKLASHKTEYDCILLDCDTADGLSHLADRFVINIREEKAEDLDSFDQKKIICVLKLKPS